MAKKIEKQRFEFLLLINGNIICQRYFDIRNYQDATIKSPTHMKSLMDRIAGMNNDDFGTMGIIPNHLKKNTIDLLWGYYKPFEVQTVEDIPRKDIYEKNDVFGFQIKVDDRVVAATEFLGDYFPPKVRYQVNIRELIPDIISEIRDSLSQKQVA